MTLALLVLALLGQPDIPEPPREITLPGRIVRGPDSDGWFRVDIGRDDEDGASFCLKPTTAIVWHLDHRVRLRPADLHPGTRIRFVSLYAAVDWIEVISLGPCAMEAAVEEFVAMARGPVISPDAQRLGAPCYQIRQGAAAALRRRGLEAMPTLIHARLSGDVEVLLRAESLLLALGWEPPR